MRSLLLLLVLLGIVPSARAAELIIISPHWEGIRKEYGVAFAKWHEEHYGEPVDVEWLDMGGTSDDVKFIRAEFESKPEGIGIDIFWGGGTDPYVSLAEEELLEAYQAPDDILNAIPPDYFGMPMYDADYLWYGTAMAGFGIITNSYVIQRMGLPEVTTWADLARPEYATWVGSADPRSSGSVHMMYEIILQAYGWDEGFGVIHRMGANVRSFPDSSSVGPKDVALGEVAAGIAIDLYALAQITESGSDTLQFVMPEGQTVVNPDGIGILKGASNAVIAQRMIDFVLSKEGQELLLLPAGEPGGPSHYTLGRMSVRPDVYENIGDRAVIKTNPFERGSSLQYDQALGSKRWGIVNDLIGAMVIDCHDDLTDAWDAVRRAGMPESAVQKLTAMPITADEAAELAATVWSQADAKNVEIERWTKFAKRKYAEVIAEASTPSPWKQVRHTLRFALPVALAVFVIGLFVFDILGRVRAVARRREARS